MIVALFVVVIFEVISMYSGSSPSNCLFHDLCYSRLADGERVTLRRRAHCCVAHDPPNATVNTPRIRCLSEHDSSTMLACPPVPLLPTLKGHCGWS